MKLNESSSAARRIGPLRAIDADGNPVTDFSAPGTVTVKVNDGAFVAPAGSIHVINDQFGNPSGYVYYQATLDDASTRGFLVVKLAGPCLEFTFREEVEPFPQGIPAGTSDTSLRTIGPLEAKDPDGNPVLGGVGISVAVSVNGAAWAPPGGTLDEVSGGYYDYAAPASETSSRGWIAVRLSGSCQEFVLRATVVDDSVAVPSGPSVPAGVGSEGASTTTDRAGGDVALTWSNATSDADIFLDSTDIASDRGLETAVLLSLFTDRRADDDNKPPSGDPTDRRGWWADQFSDVEGDKFGSRLWLLDRSTLSNETVLRAREYAREALAWMLEDRVVAEIDVDVERAGSGLLISVGLQRPGRDPVTFRFAHTWDHLKESA